MTKRRRALVAVASILLLAVLALVAFWLWSNTVDLTPRVVDVLHGATGREVRIKSAELTSYFPPTLLLRGVEIDNASWGRAERMATADRARLTLRTLPLLFGEISIRALDLEGAVVHLESGPEGNNWNVAAEGTGPGDDWSIDELRARESGFGYRRFRGSPLDLDLKVVSLTGRIASGELEVEGAELVGGGGELSVSGHLGTDEEASMQVLADLEGVDAHHLLDPFMNGEPPLEGPVVGRVELRSEASSPASFPGALSGRIALVMQTGSVESGLVRNIDVDLGSLLLSPIGPSTTEIRCLVCDAELEAGVATIGSLALRTPESLLVGDGSVDFGAGSWDLRLRGRSEGLALFDLESPVKVRGSFSDPRITAEPDEVLAEAGLGALIATLAGPVTATVSLLGSELLGEDELRGCRELLDSGDTEGQ